MTNTSATAAVALGILRFPKVGEVFESRKGRVKTFILDARGAGVNLPLRAIVISRMRAIRKMFPRSVVVGGIAKSGIMWGAWLAWEESLPYATVLLDGPRKSGIRREVEGDVANRNVLLVDNWMRSGDSIRKATDVVRRNGGKAIGAIVITNLPTVRIDLPFKAVWSGTNLMRAARRAGLLSHPSGCHKQE